MRTLTHICPACSGDGKDTCNNPDHGFYGFVGAMGAPSAYDACNGGRGCPVCGWDENHKVKGGGKCGACNGLGRVSEEDAHDINEDWWNGEGEISEVESFVTILLPKAH